LRPSLVAILAGAAAATAIVAAGAATLESWLLATISGGAFADVARRAGREESSAGDASDLGSALAFLAILVAAAFDVGRGSVAAPSPWLGRAFGFAVIAVGLLLRHWAARSLGASSAVRLGIGEGHRLVERGPYRWVRHPNYAALLVVAAGTALSLSSPLAIAATLGVWLPVVLWRIGREERMLVGHYGEDYERYRRRSWCLVPGLH
jgi:protein-S-isoprenylcysteine O-methyltransferase Ste14